ncbi:hypothetical protein OK074_1475 [Actinobacteria bacterium OK074]|nr:hypothetical protein OK074_1475 [Actinobacteria bacterium OK074]
MTIEWRYTVDTGNDLGILSVTGHLGPAAVRRFEGAVGWAVVRGTGPLVLDLTDLRSWSTEGQLAIIAAAHRLADAGRSLELAAIPAEGSLVPPGDCPHIPVHSDLAAAFAAHSATHEKPGQARQWRTTGWPGRDTGDDRTGE